MAERKKREDVSETAHRIVGTTIARSEGEEPEVERDEPQVFTGRLHPLRPIKVTRLREKASS